MKKRWFNVHRLGLIIGVFWNLGPLQLRLHGQAPAHFSIQVEDASQSELFGLPLRNAILATGTIQAAPSAQRLIWQSPDLTSLPSSWLKLGGPCYLEFVGPSSHPWLGHRLELDVARTRNAQPGTIEIATSSRNTRWPLDSKVSGAQAEIRPHVLVPTLLERWLMNHASNSALRTNKILPPPALGVISLNLHPGRITSLFPWKTAAKDLDWTIHSPSRSPADSNSLVLAPGYAVELRLQKVSAFGLGFSGDDTRGPVVVPIQAGKNLLCYPYLAPFKLTPLWSQQNKFLSKTKAGRLADRIVIQKNGEELHYTLEPSLGFGSYGAWRRENPLTRNYTQPPEYLKELEPGQGFYFITSQNYRNHTFRPPSP
jgi:hypothetical protein